MPNPEHPEHPSDRGYEDGLDELPPNIPPGILGEKGPNLYKVDEDGPHGLNAGLIQEWTWEMTMLAILLAYVLFFPLAFVILWRSNKISRSQKTWFTVVLASGILVVAYLFATGTIYFA